MRTPLPHTPSRMISIYSMSIGIQLNLIHWSRRTLSPNLTTWTFQLVVSTTSTSTSTPPLAYQTSAFPLLRTSRTFTQVQAYSGHSGNYRAGSSYGTSLTHARCGLIRGWLVWLDSHIMIHGDIRRASLPSSTRASGRLGRGRAIPTTRQIGGYRRARRVEAAWACPTSSRGAGVLGRCDQRPHAKCGQPPYA